jgi:hypothetical protein
MKKYLLIAIILCSLSEAKSQTLMTVAEIYDYNIGDIFIRKVGGYSAPPTYTKITITNKYYSALNDTVFYIFDGYAFTWPSTYYTSSGDTMFYTNLTDTVGSGLGVKPYYWDIFCVDTTGYTGIWVDTTYYDSTFCNVLTTRISRMDNGLIMDSCYTYFEPYYGDDEYGKGIGLKSHYYNTCSNGFPNCEQGMILLYYKKGTDSCGTAPIMTNINELNFTMLLKLFPNPFSTVTTLQTNINLNAANLSIYNALGQEIKTIKNISGQEIILHRDNLPSGIYFIRLKEDNKIIATEKLIITD